MKNKHISTVGLYEADNTQAIVLSTCPPGSIRGQIWKLHYWKIFFSYYFSARKLPYNTFIRGKKASFNSSQDFTFVFADVWYKEWFKTNHLSMYFKFFSFALYKWSQLPLRFDCIALIGMEIIVVLYTLCMKTSRSR